MKYENAGPKIAFTLDGEVLFFDENCEQIKNTQKLTKDQFIEMFNDPDHKLLSNETISVYSFKVGNPECKIVIEYDSVRICFWVDCTNGSYIRPCGPGD